MKLSDIMSTDLVILTPQQTIQEASQVFLDHQIDGAPMISPFSIMGVRLDINRE